MRVFRESPRWGIGAGLMASLNPDAWCEECEQAFNGEHDCPNKRCEDCGWLQEQEGHDPRCREGLAERIDEVRLRAKEQGLT